MNKKFTPKEADALVKKWSTGIVAVVLLFINVCLPALAIAAILYWIFWR